MNPWLWRRWVVLLTDCKRRGYVPNMVDAAMKRQIAVIGSATRDRIVSGQDSNLKWGGVVVYSGLTLARLGVSTAILTNIAPRDQAVVDLLTNAGIQVDVGASEATTEFVNYVSGDDRDQELLAQAEPISASQLAGLAAAVNHVYLGPLHPLDIELAALKALRGMDQVSLDLQGYTRRIDGNKIHTGISEHLHLALECADTVKASAEETDAVTVFFGQPLLEILTEFDVQQWLTTNGANGGCLLDRSGRRHDFDAVPIDQVADPTGAGDVFFATYLAQQLQGVDIDAALGAAAAVTSRHVEGRFVTTQQLKRTE